MISQELVFLNVQMGHMQRAIPLGVLVFASNSLLDMLMIQHGVVSLFALMDILVIILLKNVSQIAQSLKILLLKMEQIYV